MDKRSMLLKLIASRCGGNKRAFARLLGVAPTTVASWIARSTFDAELVYKSCEGVSARWLLTGEGPMNETPPSLALKKLIDKAVADGVIK